MALSKTGRFLSKAEILGVGVFSPLSTVCRTAGAILEPMFVGLQSMGALVVVCVSCISANGALASCLDRPADR